MPAVTGAQTRKQLPVGRRRVSGSRRRSGLRSSGIMKAKALLKRLEAAREAHG